MQRLFDINDLNAERPRQPSPSWTAIVPAAGRGSRLNATAPKVLYPILGRPMLHWLAELLGSFCPQVLWVLSPDGAPHVEPVLAKTSGPRSQVVIQKEPTGMADAIALCESAVHTPYTLVIWGDQITTNPRTLAAGMALMESSVHWSLVLPTLERKDPYIHFYRDAEERIVRVYEARETEEKLHTGENDCGVFLFRTEALFNVLRSTYGVREYQGAKTKERTFLNLIPLFDRGKHQIATVRIHALEETLGVNTPEDAERVSAVLKGRHDIV